MPFSLGIILVFPEDPGPTDALSSKLVLEAKSSKRSFARELPWATDHPLVLIMSDHSKFQSVTLFYFKRQQ